MSPALFPPRKKWSAQAWSQLRSITKGEVIRMLDRDPRWTLLPSNRGSARIYNNPALPQPLDIVAIHFHHSSDTFGSGLLKDTLDRICWTEDSLRRDGHIR